jgi:hypothetical protein
MGFWELSDTEITPPTFKVLLPAGRDACGDEVQRAEATREGGKRRLPDEE